MAEPLVNRYFQAPFFEQLGSALQAQDPSWDHDRFMALVHDRDWNTRALLQRMTHISQCLRKQLPADYLHAVPILERASSGFTGFDGMVFSDFVGQFGLEYPPESLQALEIFTQAGSAEFAIRQFILHHEEQTMAQMERWTKHDSEHVRRLASEGCRPRLPWAVALPRFKKDPSAVLPILEALRDDPSLYVRKSVANHINDLTKDNPEVALDLVSGWVAGASDRTMWIIKHGLRGLVKKGHPQALQLLGFKETEVAVEQLTVSSSSVTMGEALSFDFVAVNRGTATAQLVIDYQIHFVKANGKTAPKVFKLKNVSIDSGGRLSLSKSHEIKPITTRKYYPGEHKLVIQVNGQPLAEATFHLTIPGIHSES